MIELSLIHQLFKMLQNAMIDLYIYKFNLQRLRIKHFHGIFVSTMRFLQFNEIRVKFHLYLQMNMFLYKLG